MGQSPIDHTMPAAPEPPTFPPDPRQEQFFRDLGRLVDRLVETTGREPDPCSWSGYFASSPDLGHLSRLVTDAFGDWSEQELRRRWQEEVVGWVISLVGAWVQRTRGRRIRLLPGRTIHVEICTCDDHGYYRFAFQADLESSRRPAAA